MRSRHFKNLLKSLAFIGVITLTAYFAIDTVQFKNNIMSFEDYNPPSSLKVEGREIKKAKFTFIDVHSHLWDMPVMNLDNLISEMNEINMGYIINLSGSGFGPQAAKNLYFDKSIKNIQEKIYLYFIIMELLRKMMMVVLIVGLLVFAL